MALNLAQYDALLDLLAEAVAREMLEDPHTNECPHTGQGSVGIQELDDAKCIPES